ncbi:hypothetical protein WJX74_003748 [Apatococcus lobatus]|uniref:Uncharacterized protein n=1 Tax=Apatococcus lobatus TaxID=904363 RepID=A0AAW1QMB4_9CHLO
MGRVASVSGASPPLPLPACLLRLTPRREAQAHTDTETIGIRLPRESVASGTLVSGEVMFRAKWKCTGFEGVGMSKGGGLALCNKHQAKHLNLVIPVSSPCGT